jgi:hypothetical protein
MEWSIGIITAPREKGYYLDRCIQSLHQGGWTDINVFAEPGSRIPDGFSGHVIKRRKKYGDWTNWATGLYELFLSEPKTEYFLMLEDDAVVCKNLRLYLEHALPKVGDFGTISLYTPSIYHKKEFVGFHNELRGHNTWSTVTVLISHNNLIKFFSDEDVQKHRFFDIFNVGPKYWGGHASYGKGHTSVVDTVGNTIKDAVIGKWAEKNEFSILYHTPSLAEHIGVFSTLTDDDSTPDNGRMSLDFVGVDYDASKLISDHVNVRRRVMNYRSDMPLA